MTVEIVNVTVSVSATETLSAVTEYNGNAGDELAAGTTATTGATGTIPEGMTPVGTTTGTAAVAAPVGEVGVPAPGETIPGDVGTLPGTGVVGVITSEIVPIKSWFTKTAVIPSGVCSSKILKLNVSSPSVKESAYACMLTRFSLSPGAKARMPEAVERIPEVPKISYPFPLQQYHLLFHI